MNKIIIDTSVFDGIRMHEITNKFFSLDEAYNGNIKYEVQVNFKRSDMDIVNQGVYERRQMTENVTLTNNEKLPLNMGLIVDSHNKLMGIVLSPDANVFINATKENIKVDK